MQRTNTLELDSTLFFNISVNTNVLVFLEKKKNLAYPSCSPIVIDGIENHCVC